MRHLNRMKSKKGVAVVGAMVALLAVAIFSITPAYAGDPGSPTTPDWFEEDLPEEEFVDATIRVKGFLGFGKGTVSPYVIKPMGVSSQISAYLEMARYGFYSPFDAYSVIFGSWYDEGMLSVQMSGMAIPLLSYSIYAESMRTRDNWVFGPENCLAFRYRLGVFGEEGTEEVKEDHTVYYRSSIDETRYLFPGFTSGPWGMYSTVSHEDIGYLMEEVFYYDISEHLAKMSQVSLPTYEEFDDFPSPWLNVLNHYSEVEIKVYFMVTVESILHGGCGFGSN